MFANPIKPSLDEPIKSADCEDTNVLCSLLPLHHWLKMYRNN